jgi:hypothetical protein
MEAAAACPWTWGRVQAWRRLPMEDGPGRAGRIQIDSETVLQHVSDYSSFLI